MSNLPGQTHLLGHRLLGIILAGGKSSRMGRDKASLTHLSGVTFLQHAINRLTELNLPVASSGRNSEHANVIGIPDHIPDQGPAMAVWSAIRFAASEGYTAILVTPIDMPDIESEHLQPLIQSAAFDKPTCATFDNATPHPLIAIYPISLEPDIQAVAQSDRRSLRDWLASRSVATVPFPAIVQRDCNTPDIVT